MNDQVNEFLRRVAAKRAEAERQRAAPPPPPPPLSRSAPLPQRRLIEEEEVVDLSMVDEQTEQNFANVSRQLGQGVTQQSQNVGKHVSEVFDHSVGTLKASTAGEAPRRGTLPANSLIAQLIKPQSIQQAIIMNEILSRPEHLWDE